MHDLEKALEHHCTFANNPFYVEVSMLKSVVGAISEAEAEVACVSDREAITHRITLMNLNHH